MRRSVILSLAAIVALASAQPAKAQITTLYSTNFNAPTYTDGLLNPGTDTTTPGQDGWLHSSGTTNFISVSNSATNGFVSLTTTGQDVRRLFDGAATVTSGSVFFDADVTVSAAQATGDYSLHFTDGGTSNFYGRTFFRSSGAGFQLALGTSSGTTPTYGTTELPFGTPFHLLVRYDIVPGLANDTGALFVNPTTVDGSGDTPYVLATNQGIDATSIAALALRQGAAANAATLTVDNYRAFVPVPEPSSLVLLGAAAAAGMVRRFRRKTA
jgi:hypothetical protein